jgi:hypothetical protein
VPERSIDRVGACAPTNSRPPAPLPRPAPGHSSRAHLHLGEAGLGFSKTPPPPRPPPPPDSAALVESFGRRSDGAGADGGDGGGRMVATVEGGDAGRRSAGWIVGCGGREEKRGSEAASDISGPGPSSALRGIYFVAGRPDPSSSAR